MQILRRINGDHAEFMTIILWESLDAIRAFAGGIGHVRIPG